LFEFDFNGKSGKECSEENQNYKSFWSQKHTGEDLSDHLEGEDGVVHGLYSLGFLKKCQPKKKKKTFTAGVINQNNKIV